MLELIPQKTGEPSGDPRQSLYPVSNPGGIRVERVCPTLPEPVKTGIVAMVRASGSAAQGDE